MARNQEQAMAFDSLKQCIEAERLAEGKFVKYFMTSVALGSGVP